MGYDALAVEKNSLTALNVRTAHILKKKYRKRITQYEKNFNNAFSL